MAGHWRWGLGPVFVYECLTGSRRWQLYAGRAASLGLILALMLLFGSWRWGEDRELGYRELAEVGRGFFSLLASTQLALVMLAAPAATAGAICMEKARGTLTHLMVTDLSDAEIVLGKLAARFLPVLGLVAATMPLAALMTLLGGVDPDAILGAYLVTLAVGLLGCALALVISVWAGKPHEVVMAVYGIWVAWFLSGPVLGLVEWYSGRRLESESFYLSNPFVVLTGDVIGTMPRRVWTPWIFAAALAGLSAVLAGLAILRIRPVASRQEGRSARATGRGRRLRLAHLATAWIPSPSLDANPVLWRECRRRRPSRFGQFLWACYALAACGFSVLAIGQMLASDAGAFGSSILGTVVNGLQIPIGLLMLSASTATSLAEERARGSLDVLMATPLPTSTIVMGKWWAGFRPVVALAVPPTLVALFAALAEGRGFAFVVILFGMVLAYGASINSLGLAMATWTPRLSRAIGLTVALCVGPSLLWPVFVLIGVGGSSGGGGGLAALSPIYGAFLPTALIDVPYNETQGEVFVWLVVCIVVHVMIAGTLAAATLGTFDAALGRAAEARTFAVNDPETAAAEDEASAGPEAEVGPGPEPEPAAP